MKRWKKFLEFDYEVSDHGDVCRIGAKKCLCPEEDRYFTVDLWKDNVKNRFKVHRLVAILFVPNLENLPFVLHGDGNGLNNYYKNLRWGTQQENLFDAMKHGTWKKPPCYKGVDNLNSKYDENDVLFVKALLKNSGLSQQKIALVSGVNRSFVRDVKLGNSWGWLK